MFATLWKLLAKPGIRLAQKAARSQILLQLEGLEGRDVPSGSTIPSTVTPVLANGILTVHGTVRADAITVTQSGSSIGVAGRTFAASAVNTIVIVGESGDDTITVGAAITKPASIYGGGGDDTVYGGGGADAIYGSWGADRLFGRGGNDLIYGGTGSDVVDGGIGTNGVFQESPLRSIPQSPAGNINNVIIQLTNAERARFGLPALRFNGQLSNAANLHAANMASRSNAIGENAAHNHTLYGTMLPSMTSRIDFVGYNYSSIRENIAYGYPSAQAVVEAWMNSPGHRANILSTDITEIGVSVQTNARGVMFFCQNFGSRF